MSYAFYKVYVNGYYNEIYKIKLTDIITCSNISDGYYIRYPWGSVDIESQRDEHFEAMFPDFPYDKTKSGEPSQITQVLQITQLKNQMEYLEQKIEQRIDKIENDTIKLLSHVEAIMTVLQQRLPTDDPLTL